jgi:eukaryotic-like serine/threonine-protein kinase
VVEHQSFDKLVGTTLGNYRLERLIEQSELGAVFLASKRDASGDGRDKSGPYEKTTYLLRVLAVPTDLTADARMVYLGRFQKEANQVAELKNSYILPLLDYGNHQGTPYLVSPNLPVTSLSAVLTQKGPLDVLVASRYLDQVATALEYAHEHAVLHRNLSTDCIFLKHDGNLVVADFGVMRMLELSRSDPQQSGRPQGSPLHPTPLPPLHGNSLSSAPAPEQLLGKPIDTYTDVYALGAVLYRMLTAHRVFRGTSREEIVQQHLQAPVPSISKWRSGLPSGIDGIIASAMAKEPAQRFRQPGALANAFHQSVAPDDTARKPLVIGAPPSPSPADHDKASQRQRINVVAGDPVWGTGNAPARTAPAPRGPSPRISRRRALTIIGAGSGAAVAIAAVAVFASHYLVGNTSPTATTSVGNPQASNPPPVQGTKPPPTQRGHVLAHTSDIPLNSAKPFPNPKSQNPILLIHLINNQFVAFDSTCTHAGCPVSYNSQNKLLECPCHGAVFDPARGAAVVAGPAPTPLAKIPITVNADGTITEP